MHYPFLQSLVVIFGVSALVVFLLNRIKIPSLVGFLVAGIIIGPHALGLVRELKEIEVFAEVGVILLLFTLGMEFSLKKLLRMRRIVFGSGSFQVLLTIAVTCIIAVIFLNFSFEKAVFWGFLIALSSTAIVIKSIADKNESSTPQGRAMIGIVLFQDLSVVLFIILVPLMGGAVDFSFSETLIIILKAIAVIVFVIAGSRWLVPFIFDQIVKTKSRELFIISIMLFCIGTAMFTSAMGLSLSLGAFLAGMMLSESDYAYQAMSDVVPFKESFMGLFFVSVGMLLNVSFAADHFLPVFLFFVLILLAKFLIGYVAVILAGFSSRTAIIAGLGIAQIGEFSFVLAIEGRKFGLINEDLYQIFIATSILSMLATPFVYKAAAPFASWIIKNITPNHFKNHNPLLYSKEAYSKGTISDHVIIAGFGFNGRNLAAVLKRADIPYVIIDNDLSLVKENKAKGEPVYFGDATSADILKQMGISKAKMLVCTLLDPISQRIIISHARKASKCIYILTRTRHVKAVEELKNLGANDVIPEEFETSLEIFHRVFLHYNMSPETIENTLGIIRQNNYSLLRDSSEDKMSILGKLQCIPEVDIRSVKISEVSAHIGKTVRDMNVRQETGVTVLAIRRDGELITTPNLEIPLMQNDILLFTGDNESISKAMDFFNI
jgi:monovalent cation:H+ antiporter-2, CPA2 family